MLDKSMRQTVKVPGGVYILAFGVSANLLFKNLVRWKLFRLNIFDSAFVFYPEQRKFIIYNCLNTVFYSGFKLVKQPCVDI
jgi:hypothetical protein